MITGVKGGSTTLTCSNYLLTKRFQHQLRLTPAHPKRSNTGSCSQRHSACLLTDDVARAFSGQLVVWRSIPHGLLKFMTESPYYDDSPSAHGSGYALRADNCRPADEESSASSSRVGWGSAPRNSLKASMSIRKVSVKFWTFPLKISACVGFLDAHVLHLHWAGNRSGQGSRGPSYPGWPALP
ncbi:hypothetical protein TIFTF001_017810 [Ficus carica]|uniref:Uncharacterized protein n=1 Tax=Ficus carica TaxID=3494 RepID=A0AA88ABC7_FICCA|nr:hypothetical protein TIFTF001_017810 [Ficus carica]